MTHESRFKEEGLISRCRTLKEEKEQVKKLKDEAILVLTGLSKLKEEWNLSVHTIDLEDLNKAIDKWNKRVDELRSEWLELNRRYSEIREKIIKMI